MRLHRLIIALSTVCMVASSCYTDDAGMDAASSCGVASLVICTRVSRADIDDAGNFAFSAGDRISLFSQNLVVDMDGINAEVADGYALAYDGEYIYDGDKKAIFQAVYPCSAVVDGDDVTFTVCQDQSQDDNYKASYMLWSQGEGSAGNTTVQLKFGHVMSMICVRIKDTSEVGKVTLHGATLTARLNIRNGAVSAESEEHDIVMRKGVDNKFCAIVPPQNLATGAFTIEAEIGGELHVYTLASDATLKSGHACNFTLTPSKEPDEFVFPDNSLIPKVSANLKLSPSQEQQAAPGKGKWKKGEWYFNSIYASSVDVITDGGGFNCVFRKKEDLRGYNYPCLAFWSNSDLDLTKTYKLDYDVMSATVGKLGVAVYDKGIQDPFFYHANTSDDGVEYDSKTAYMEHTTSDVWKHVTVEIDPTEGSANYALTTSETSSSSYFKKNDGTMKGCVLVFYNAYKADVKYTIKNIVIVPVE